MFNWLRGRPWPQATAWLLFLAPFFFIVYGFCNQYTASRSDVGILVYGWEKHIPFTPSLILPYMSIDFFFGLSLFLCTHKPELHRHALRLMLAIVISAIGFLLFPLQFSFDVPATGDGFNGTLFKALHGFDKPFNQAPSLHISLLMLLWVIYHRYLQGAWRWVMHIWFALIGVSVLTVYQHHFIDVVTGFIVGLMCLYVIPDHGWKTQPSADRQRANRLGHRYLAGSLICATLAYAAGGWAWLALWPGMALLLVAVGYYQLGPSVFHKIHGKHHWVSRLLLAPYLAGVRLSHRHYLRKLQPWHDITPQLAIGAWPADKQMLPPGTTAVLDLTGEFSASFHPADLPYLNLPVMDLTAPDTATLHAALQFIDRYSVTGKVFVHCALGLSRSATVAAAWLVEHGQFPDADTAFRHIANIRQGVVWQPAHLSSVASAVSKAKP